MPRKPSLFPGDLVIVKGYGPDDTIRYDGTVGKILRFGGVNPDDGPPDAEHGYDYRVEMEDGYSMLCWEEHLTKIEDGSDPDATDDAALAAFLGE